MTTPSDAENGAEIRPEQDLIVVLLVDDEHAVAEAIRRALLGEPNIQFHACSSAHEAMQVAERVVPTVILQDAVFPTTADGLALVRGYRNNPLTKDVPILMLAAEDASAAKGEAFAAGASDYLVKLPDRVELIARLRYHSQAYWDRIRRDEAFRALRDSQRLLTEKSIELERLSRVDAVTGLRNHQYFNEFADIQWKRAAREHTPLSILKIDVDDFESYREVHGHLAGDQVLRIIGQAIVKCCQRPTDLAARFEREEFVVALSPTALEGTQIVADRLRASIAALEIPHRSSSTGSHLTVSIGGAWGMPKHGEAFEAFIDMADAALDEARSNGKNSVVIHPITEPSLQRP